MSSPLRRTFSQYPLFSIFWKTFLYIHKLLGLFTIMLKGLCMQPMVIFRANKYGMFCCIDLKAVFSEVHKVLNFHTSSVCSTAYHICKTNCKLHFQDQSTLIEQSVQLFTCSACFDTR